MTSKFKVGDLVKLKTGSHSMKIKCNATRLSKQVPVSIPDRYECMWSDGKKMQTAVFREDVLQLV
jgi:uncharacterized protein YodC (DUF2158 family)